MRPECLVLLICLLAGPAYAGSGGGSSNNGQSMQTVKERLSTKAADPQRVDDCKVPLAQRDPSRPRPTKCGNPVSRTANPGASKATN